MVLSCTRLDRDLVLDFGMAADGSSQPRPVRRAVRGARGGYQHPTHGAIGGDAREVSAERAQPPEAFVNSAQGEGAGVRETSRERVRSWCAYMYVYHTQC